VSMRTWQTAVKCAPERHFAPTLIATIAALLAVQSGCGSDDSEDPGVVSKDAGAATASKDGGKQPAGPNIPKTFVVACLNTKQNTCSEFLGAQSKDNDIMAGAEDSCAQADEMLQTTPCKTDSLAGSCLSFGDVAGATRWVQDFYYTPLTEEMVKNRCQGDQYVPAGG
jgi:hypothetical protein